MTLATLRQTIRKNVQAINQNNLLVYIVLFCCWSTVHPVEAAFPVTPNTQALAQSDSPYLAMHARDPVHWQTWHSGILTQAQKKNKLIMLSSGYFACHWCHVMQKQNYRDAEVARFLNKHFISVKIDRELLPDLDHYMIQFARKASGHAGWPQHVFLTPTGEPFFALTYQPKPRFLRTLKNLVTLWQQSPDRIQRIARQAIESANSPAKVDSQTDQLPTLSTQTFDNALLKQIAPQTDTLSGGLKGTRKFPEAPLLNTLVTQPDLTEDLQDWLLLTLDQMQNAHLQDHIHGGFFRYCVDPDWQIPHFEKMLYTQAQLAQLYFLAAHRFNRADYQHTANATLNYVENTLFNPETGLFQSSQSAIDNRQIEGGGYLWTKSQLKRQLSSADYAIVKEAWRLDQPAPFHIEKQEAWLPTPTDRNWPKIQSALRMNRSPLDSKSILGWNGLLLSAYATATEYSSATLQQQRRKRGNALATRLVKLATQPGMPRALSKNNTPMGHANIQDYAYLIQGLKDWNRLDPTPVLRGTIQQLEKRAHQLFLGHTGWAYSNTPKLPGQTGHELLEDDAMPSPTAILECGHTTRLKALWPRLLSAPVSYSSYRQTLSCQKLK